MCNCDHNQVSEYTMLIFITYFKNLIILHWKQTKSDHIDVNVTLRADFMRENVYFE